MAHKYFSKRKGKGKSRHTHKRAKQIKRRSRRQLRSEKGGFSFFSKPDTKDEPRTFNLTIDPNDTRLGNLSDQHPIYKGMARVTKYAVLAGKDLPRQVLIIKGTDVRSKKPACIIVICDSETDCERDYSNKEKVKFHDMLNLRYDISDSGGGETKFYFNDKFKVEYKIKLDGTREEVSHATRELEEVMPQYQQQQQQS